MAAWASNWKQRIRFAPLHLALLVADALARWSPGRWPQPRNAHWRPGISVLVPERGTPDLLAECLDAAVAALAQIDEPSELIVVVNGAPEADYATLRQRHPQIRWSFHAQALGYNGAIASGLRLVQHDWVYLLNSDMRLESDALGQLLPHRQPEVFAITSQIHFVDTERRREETGWSDCRIVGAQVQMFERDPDPKSQLTRSNLYPGGGSSLCRTAVLRRYVADSACYSPFYYEDAEWGARAWAEGWEVLFCPASHAHHHHRGTVRRHYDPVEVQRVVGRNAQLFELRHGWTELTPARAMAKTCDNDYRTQQELSKPALARSVFAERLRARRALARGLLPEQLATDRYYPPPRPTAGKPRVLLVTPFALFPPAHGGARRIAELCSRLADQVDLILLSDERWLYGAESEPYLAAFRAVHLIEGRGDKAGEALDLPQRLQRHSHPRMRRELDRLLAVYQPDIVQLEFMELAALKPAGRSAARWILALHDVLLDGGATDALQQQLLAGMDALTVCSAEDAALLDHRSTALVSNGAPDRRSVAAASPDAPNVLFMGPFRYGPNQAGIRAFVEQAWPAIRAAHPQATLTILGGPESAPHASADWLRAPGIELVSRFVDPAPCLARASLTINPQLSIRGSALKLIESLLAARVCVSTEDGARGFTEPALAGLVRVADIAAMAQPVIQLLSDPQRRRALERADGAALQRWTWDGIAAEQLALYRRLLGAR